MTEKPNVYEGNPYVVLGILPLHCRNFHFYRHVITHSLQLHGGSHQIELVQAGHIAVEGLLRAWFKTLVHQDTPASYYPPPSCSARTDAGLFSIALQNSPYSL